MRRSTALDNLSKTIPAIDEEAKDGSPPFKAPLHSDVNLPNYKRRTLSMPLLLQCFLLRQRPQPPILPDPM